MKLSPAQHAQFDRDGYLFFPSLFTPDEIRVLTEEVPRLYAQHRPENVRAKGSEAGCGYAVPVTLRANPGAFGLILEAGSPFQAGGQITFKYAVHFQAPPEATAKYPNHVLLERALAVGRLAEGGQIDLLPSVRPASDNLEAPAAAPGTYVVAAPR